MQEDRYSSLGHVASTEVGVQSTLEGQDILAQQTGTGQDVAALLALDNVDFLRVGDLCWLLKRLV